MAMSKAEILASVGNIDFVDLRLLRNIIEGLVQGAGGTQTLTASGAVATTTTNLELDHTSVTIAATMDVSNYLGDFTVTATTEPGAAADHTLTVSGGTFDGTNTVATFADVDDSLTINWDGAGNGTVVSNVGSVVLS